MPWTARTLAAHPGLSRPNMSQIPYTISRMAWLPTWNREIVQNFGARAKQEKEGRSNLPSKGLQAPLPPGQGHEHRWSAPSEQPKVAPCAPP